MQISEYQSFTGKTPENSHKNGSSVKSTHQPPGGVGEEWPALLSKKWLAAKFGCLMSNGAINRRRFRALVLTEEVLTRAGIPLDLAYSRSTKTFNAIQSMSLTTILRGFCLAILLSISVNATAQTAVPGTLADLAPISIFDTIPGTMVVSDSIIRMVQVRPGEYKYQAVLSTIVFDGYMVKEIQAPPANTLGNRKLLGHRFYHKAWGLVDPKRVLLFKTNQ